MIESYFIEAPCNQTLMQKFKTAGSVKNSLEVPDMFLLKEPLPLLQCHDSHSNVGNNLPRIPKPKNFSQVESF